MDVHRRPLDDEIAKWPGDTVRRRRHVRRGIEHSLDPARQYIPRDDPRERGAILPSIADAAGTTALLARGMIAGAVLRGMGEGGRRWEALEGVHVRREAVPKEGRGTHGRDARGDDVSDANGPS